MQGLKKLQHLLEMEREADIASFSAQTRDLSVAERRQNGTTWYPIAIRSTEITRGDYLMVEMERTTHQDLPHQFHSGMPVAIFSNHHPQEDRIEGVLNFCNDQRMKVQLKSDELPEWSRQGKLGIDLLFDHYTYKEMKLALKSAEKLLDDKDKGTLIRLLLGDGQPSFISSKRFDNAPDRLNETQKLAIQKILDAQDLAIIHGPPGTGKTTTLVAAVAELVKRGEKILIVAPSNNAVDLLSQKISGLGLQVLRIGNPARVSEEIMALTVDEKLANHPDRKQLKDLKRKASEFKRMAHQYKRQFGKAEREQRNALFNEAHSLMKDADRIEDAMLADLIDKAQVIAATLVGSNHFSLQHQQFDTLLIDEAGQALEPACWIPILKAKKVILAGDHCQLPPTIKSDAASREGLSTTLMEKCVVWYPEAVTMLMEQYRMNQSIMAYPSKVFYENKLIADKSVISHTVFNDNKPFHFIDTAGCGYDDSSESTSTINKDEAAFLVKHLTSSVEEFEKGTSTDNFPSIAVIAPYQAQVVYLRELVKNAPLLQKHLSKINVNTIDSFQGQEKDVVFISLTRSNAESKIGFLSDIRRMNVAMTRARKKLVMIGDSATIAQHPFYAGLIDYAENLEAYQSAWEFV